MLPVETPSQREERLAREKRLVEGEAAAEAERAKTLAALDRPEDDRADRIARNLGIPKVDANAIAGSSFAMAPTPAPQETLDIFDFPTRQSDVDKAPWARGRSIYADIVDEYVALNPERFRKTPEDQVSILDDARRNLSIEQAIKANPDEEARIRDIAGKLQMPPAMVRAIGLAEAANRLTRQQAKQVGRDAPATLRLLTDQDRAKIAIDDFNALSGVERTLRELFVSNEITANQTAISKLSRKMADGVALRPSEMFEYERLKARNDILQRQRQMTDNGVTWFTNTIAEGATDFALGLPEMATYGAAGAVVGLLGGPGGAAQGFRIGAGVGQFAYNFDQIIGHSFEEYKNFRDDLGRLIDQDAARGAAYVNAVLSVGLEVAGERALMKTVPGLDKLVGGKDVVKSLLRTQAGRNVMLRIGKKVATGAIIEGVTEGLQQLTQIYTGEVLKIVAPGEFAPIAPEEVVSQTLQAAAAGAVGTLGITVPGATAQVFIENRELRKADKELTTSEGTVNRIEAAIAAAADTKLVNRDRGELERFINDAAADSPVSTIYLSAEDLATVATKAGLEPIQLAQQLGVSDQIQTAATTGSLLEMPIGKFIATVANTDLATPLTQVIKTNPFLLNRVEQEAYASTGRADIIAEADRLVQEAVTDETFAAEAQSIQDEVLQQFRAIEGGEVFTPEVSRAYSTITTQGYVSLARRMGISPREAYQKYQGGPLRIQREAGVAEGMGQPVIEQAQSQGYTGQDIGEAQEWVRAREKGLDMSRPARMERARAMGFDTDTVLYHGTGADIAAFSTTKARDVLGRRSALGLGGGKIYMSTDPSVSSLYAGTRGGDAAVMPLYVRGELIDEREYARLFEEKAKTILGQSRQINEPYSFGYEQADRDAVISALDDDVKAQGFAGIRDAELGQVAVFNPANIRSVNAAFDPDFAESANILAQDKNVKVSPEVQAELLAIYNDNIETNNTALKRFQNSEAAWRYTWNKVTEADLRDRIGDDEELPADAMRIINKDGFAIEYGSDSTGVVYASEKDAPTQNEFWLDAAAEEGWIKASPTSVDEIFSVGLDEFALAKAMQHLAETEGWEATRVRGSYRYQTIQKRLPNGVVYLNVRVSDHAKQSRVGHAVYGKDDIDINLAPATGDGNEQYSADDFDSMLLKMRQAERRGPKEEDLESPNILAQSKPVETRRDLDAMGFYSAVQEAAKLIPDNIWNMGWQAVRNALAKGREGITPRKTEIEYLGLDAMFGDTRRNYVLKGAELKDAVMEHIAAKRLSLVENFARFDPTIKPPSKPAILDQLDDDSLSNMLGVQELSIGDGKGRIIAYELDGANEFYTGLFIELRKDLSNDRVRIYDLFREQPLLAGGKREIIATDIIGNLKGPAARIIANENRNLVMRKISAETMREYWTSSREDMAANALVRGAGDIRLPGEDVPLFEAVIGIPKGVPGAEYQASISHVGGKAKGTLVTAHGEERIDDKGQRTVFVGQVQSDMAQQAREDKQAQQEALSALRVYENDMGHSGGRKYWVKMPAGASPRGPYASMEEAEQVKTQILASLNITDLNAPLLTTSEWTNVAVRAMIYRAARGGFQSISFPTAETSELIQGNDAAAQHYETNVKGALEKLAKQLGGEVRRGGVGYAAELRDWASVDPDTAQSLLNEVWKKLPVGLRQTLSANLPNTRRDSNTDEFYVSNGQDPRDADAAGFSRETFNYELRQAKGNPLIAAYSIWVQGAVIWQEPGAFEQMLETAGGGGALVAAAFEKAKTVKADAYILDLTPAMREKIMSEGFPLFQERRAIYRPDLNTIRLLPKADWSSYLHEMGHHFLEVYNNAALQIEQMPEADRTPDEQKIVDDMRILLTDMARQAGVTVDGDVLQWWANTPLEGRTPVHEKYAEATEKYFMEGKAPVPELQALFDRFKEWLIKVYQNLTALNVELTPEVRGVMDRMYAAHETVKTAEYNRRLVALFREKPETMTDQEWRAYQELGAQATSEAQDDLTARSLRDMQWASGAKARVLRDMQRDNAEKRKVVRAEVAAEVMARPVNVARSFFRRGIAPNGEPVTGPHKLNIDLLKARYPDVSGVDWKRLGYGQYGMLAKDGIDPDMAAEMLGYPSGEGMIRDLLAAGPAEPEIDAETDRRMLERFGDLTDEAKMSKAADEVIHSALRAKVLQAEYAALAKAARQTKPLVIAAKEIAKEIVGRQLASKLNLNKYLAAERAAGRKAEAALRSGDFAAAASAKRDQLLNFEVVREAQRVLKERDKALDLFSRINKAKRETVSKTRNYDLVQAARAVLAAYGFGSVKNKPMDYMNAVKAYDPALYSALEPTILEAVTARKTLDQLTVAEFMGLRDVVRQFWDLSRAEMKVDIEGRQLDLEDIIQDLNGQLEAQGVAPKGPSTEAATDWQKRLRQFAGLKASMRRVETWARLFDRGKVGAFTKFIWRPVSEAADRYRTDRNTYILRFRELFRAIEPTMAGGKINAPEINYTFKNKSELLHAILHTGNGSNYRKLLLGRGWGSEDQDGNLIDNAWVNLINRLSQEGVLNKADFDFAQSVWDLLEEIKPLAQATHKKVFGNYFSEITAEAVQTPFGTYKGGYVPAVYDTYNVQDAALRAQQEAVEANDSTMFPSPASGFTKSRVEYNRELALDLMIMSSHIDKVLKFAHLASPVRDVLKILRNKSFSAMLESADPTAQSDMLLPWLTRAARQITEEPTKGQGGPMVDGFFRAIRQRSGMGLMFANMVNVAQQVTGFSVAALTVKPKYLASGMIRYMRDPIGLTRTIRQASMMMADRGDNQLAAMYGEIDKIIDKNDKYGQARDWFGRHTYFMQQGVQNVMDVIVWAGAYDQALAGGATETEAAKQGDAAVRQTQGTTFAEDVSRIETGPAVLRSFVHMYSYFNMWGNLLSTEMRTAVSELGLKKGAGRLMFVYMAGFAIPALLAQLIADGLRGQLPEDEDDDGWLDEWLSWFFGTQAKTTLAFAPIVGQAGNATIGAFTDVPYDDRVGGSPAISTIEASVRTPASVYEAIAEDGDKSRAVKDVLTLMTTLTGLPFQVLGRPIGYAVDVAEGDITPTSTEDYIRGLITGAASEASR